MPYWFARRSRRVYLLPTVFQTSPHEFNRGLSVGLLGEEPGADWKEQAFAKLCGISDYLIHSRGYQEWK